MEPIIVPAIIAKTQAELDEMLESLRGHARRVMLDVMDGRFVPSSSLDFGFKLPHGFEYEAHLMVENPQDYVEPLASKVKTLILHYETLNEQEAIIKQAKERGLEVVLALNPETPVEALQPLLEEIDGVLIMTVKPGGYGGRFLPETLGKVRKVRGMHHAIPLEVDGGMNPENARAAMEAGADVIASGSYIMKSGNIPQAISELEHAVRK